MAQQQTNIHIAEAGFNGLDTVSSPITQDYSFAAVADNCVIDRYGRIGARKAFAEDSTTLPTVTAIPGATTHEWNLHTIQGGEINGDLSVICTASYTGFDAGGNAVGTTYHILEKDGANLVELTTPALPAPATIMRAMIVPTDDRWYICSEDNETLVWNGTTIVAISAQVGYVGIQTAAAGPQVAPTFIGAVASHGRVWGWGHEGDDQTIFYSDLLIGASYFTADTVDPQSSAGAINVLEQWPNGMDKIISVAVHNNRLVVFGRRSVLVYELGYGDPADAASGFALQDTITNVGLVSRDAIAAIGSDLLFMDDTGVRSLGRTIQEESSPMGDLTHRVRQDISNAVFTEPDKSVIKLEYDSTENLVVALFTDYAYILDMKSYFTQGSAKITKWNQCLFNDLTYFEAAGDEYLLMAGKGDRGVMRYDGYVEKFNTPYVVRYRTNPLNFGQPASSKFVKQIDYTIISQNATALAQAIWGYDTLETTKTRTLTVDAIDPAFYIEGEYNVAKFGNSDATLRRYRINTGGKGESFLVGIELEIFGNAFSLQEINLQALTGRLN